ncbi:MAG TPA: urocanate hydratase [Terriglobia bacterium]|nr:urocanate hydratase [Terriglobia bacterium]
MEPPKIRDRNHGPSGKDVQTVRSPRGQGLNCQGWHQEAALRMLMNSLDPNVAEQPDDLIACGASQKILRDWESYHAAVKVLKGLKNDETLLVQSGTPNGVYKTQQNAPRVIITNSTPEGKWPTSDKLDQIYHRGVIIPWPADPASWTYLGTQQYVPVAFQVFDAIARKHFGDDLGGKLIVSGGMGAAGGALPLAAVMLGAAFLGIDVDGERIRRRIRAGYCDYCVNTLEEALRILKNAVRQKQGVSVGLVGNCAEIVPELASRGVLPDVLTDQTSAHDLLNGYIPSSLNADDAAALRRANPHDYISRSRHSIVRHLDGMLALQQLGSVVFEFGNNLRAAAQQCGAAGAASALPHSVEDYLQPLLSAGLAPVRWVALSGEPADIRRFDELALELFPDDLSLARWIQLARKHVRFQGLPARVCWMDQEKRIQQAERLNTIVAEGIMRAPFVVAFDQVEINRQTSSQALPAKMEDKQDADGDWPIPDVLAAAASETTWASLTGEPSYSQATMALIVDGTSKSASSFARVLKSDYARDFIRRATPRL